MGKGCPITTDTKCLIVHYKADIVIYRTEPETEKNKDKETKNKYVRLQGRPYIHTCPSYVHTPRDFTNGTSLARRVASAITEL